MTTDVDVIRQSVHILDVLDALDLPRPNAHGKIRSWLRDETQASVQIYEHDGDFDNWFDYGAGIGGGVIELVMSYYGCSFGKAVKYLRGSVDEGLVGRKLQRLEKQPVDLWARFMTETRSLDEAGYGFVDRQWGPAAMACLKSNRFDVRQGNDSLWIAHWGLIGEVFAVVGIKVRGLQGQRFSVDGSMFTQQLYGSVLDPVHHTAVITEGEPDTWTLDWILQDKADVYGLPSGAGLWKEHWLKQLETYDNIILCLDNDDAGWKAHHRISKALGHRARGIPLLPKKDISDSVMAGYNPLKEWKL